jgi:hypothetical protein
MTDRAAAAIVDLVELDAELRGAVRPLCAAVAQLAGQAVFCARPRHAPDDPEHYGVVWLQVDGRSCLGAVTWSPARPS